MMHRVQNFLSSTQVYPAGTVTQAKNVDTNNNGNVKFVQGFVEGRNVNEELLKTPPSSRKNPLVNQGYSPGDSPNSAQKLALFKLKVARKKEQPSPKTAEQNFLLKLKKEQASLKTTSEKYLVGRKIDKKIAKRGYTNGEVMRDIRGLFKRTFIGVSSNVSDAHKSHSQEFLDAPFSYSSKRIWVRAENDKALHGKLNSPANIVAHTLSVIGGRDTLVNLAAGGQRYYPDGTPISKVDWDN